jgi:hypothetical protein
MFERVLPRRRHAARRESPTKRGKPTEESPMGTRTIAIAALVIAVVLLIIFLV